MPLQCLDIQKNKTGNTLYQFADIMHILKQVKLGIINPERLSLKINREQTDEYCIRSR
jgi:hypothetical protein